MELKISRGFARRALLSGYVDRESHVLDSPIDPNTVCLNFIIWSMVMGALWNLILRVETDVCRIFFHKPDSQSTIGIELIN